MLVTDGQVRKLRQLLEQRTPLAIAAGRTGPRLLAKTLFQWLRQRHPAQFLDSHKRTFERRVRQWRAANGSGKLAIFRQVHQVGDLAASDFTHMDSLAITIACQP